MFAVIKTGGKQYSVAAEDTITVMTLTGEPGDVVTFDDVLMLAGDGEPTIGAPFIEGRQASPARSSRTSAVRRSSPSRKDGGRIPSASVATARFDSGADHRVFDRRREAFR